MLKLKLLIYLYYKHIWKILFVEVRDTWLDPAFFILDSWAIGFLFSCLQLEKKTSWQTVFNGILFLFLWTSSLLS